MRNCPDTDIDPEIDCDCIDCEIEWQSSAMMLCGSDMK